MSYRLKISLLAAGLILASSTMAAQRGHDPDRPRHRGGPEIATQVMEHLGKAIRRLDLSEEQQKSIHVEFGVFRESVKPLAKELHEGRKALRELVTSDSYDAAAVSDVAARQGELTTEITIVASEAVAGVLALLNEEQRAQLKALGEERRAKREGHQKEVKARVRERMEARGESPPEGN